MLCRTDFSWHTGNSLQQIYSNMSKMSKKTRGFPISVNSLERLVELVCQNPSVYEPSSPNHKDAIINGNIWESISEKKKDNLEMSGMYM